MDKIVVLTTEEMLLANGGDSFMRNLGRGIGKICGAIENAVDDFVASQAHYAYRCNI